MRKEEFKICFDQYFDAIRNYLYYKCGDSELATDITQDAFMRVWEKQFDYDPKGTKSLLYKIAGDMLISHFRKKNTAGKYMETLELNPKDNSAEEAFHYKELKQNYEKALAKLPEKQRTVFLMSRMENLTYREIAERLDLSVKAIEKRMSQAIADLKKRLNYHGTK